MITTHILGTQKIEPPFPYFYFINNDRLQLITKWKYKWSFTFSAECKFSSGSSWMVEQSGGFILILPMFVKFPWK